MTKIVFSPAAIQDMQETKAYISEELCNPQAATRVLDKIMRRIQSLELFPESGPLLSSIVGFDTNYRFLVCGNYTAFYRVEDDTVKIIRILYGRRDFMRILFGIAPDEENI